MLITLDPRTGAHQLQDPHDFTSFAVVVPSVEDLPLVGHAVPASLGSATPDGEHVVVSRDAVRALAGPAADDPSWSAGFEEMLSYADRHGWLTPDGTGIRAHCSPADGPYLPDGT